MITNTFDNKSKAIINSHRNENAPKVDACILTFSHEIEKDYLVYVPDFDIYTEGIKPTLTLLPNKTILEVNPYETSCIL